jgi:hypothetical protein
MYVRVALEGAPGLVGPRCLGLMPGHHAGRLAGKQGHGERRMRRSTNPHLMIDPIHGLLPIGKTITLFFKREAAGGAGAPLGQNTQTGRWENGQRKSLQTSGGRWSDRGPSAENEAQNTTPLPGRQPFSSRSFLRLIASRHPFSPGLLRVQDGRKSCWIRPPRCSGWSRAVDSFEERR